MNTQEFIEKFVTIDFVESSGCYGHFPFQMFVEKADGSFEADALAISGVVNCYRIFVSKLDKKPKSVFMALDFPAGGDIETDFVAVFSFENGAMDILAIPYNPKTGEKKEVLKTSHLLAAIKSQLAAFAFCHGQMI